MKKFLRKYKFVVIAFFVSISYLIACLFFYEWNDNIPEIKVFDILCQISVGLIINSIFLYTQVFLLNYKQRKYIDKTCAEIIEKICSEIRNLFDRMNEMCRIRSSIKEYNEFDFLNLLQQTKFDDKVPGVINPLTIQPYVLREYIIVTVERVENNIKKLCNMFAQYMSVELLSILEEILDSCMHTNFARSLLFLNISFSGTKDDPYYFSYYKMLEKLEIEKNKMIGN